MCLYIFFATGLLLPPQLPTLRGWVLPVCASLPWVILSSAVHLTPGRRRHHLWGTGWLCPVMQTDRGQKRSLIQEGITERHLSGWEGNCKEAKWGCTETEKLQATGNSFRWNQAVVGAAFSVPHHVTASGPSDVSCPCSCRTKESPRRQIFP